MQEVQILVFYVQWSLSGLLRTNGHAVLKIDPTKLQGEEGSKEIDAALVKHLGLTRGNPYEFKNGRTGVKRTSGVLVNPAPYQIPTL